MTRAAADRRMIMPAENSQRESDFKNHAEKPGQDAMRLHPFYKGKVEVSLKCSVRSIDDFAIWYTPGVAEPCLDIRDNPENSYLHTNRANSVAVVSDGTRVLGLGDIGPEAAMPVMEGKALLFKYLGGVDAVPICIDTKDPDEIIRTVQLLQPSFGGINLEDIAHPKCFRILDELRSTMSIPVWHDDQQGTAAVTVAGLINALKIVNKDIAEVKIALVGAGAANVRIAHLIIAAGANPRNLYITDSKGILGTHRIDIENQSEKHTLAVITNGRKLKGDNPDAIKNADVLIALSKPGPGTIKPEWVASMNKKAIVFACANPVPEIWPWEAKEAGAAVVATARSDFPNQVNNSLGFPGIFRGALDVRAATITDEMCLAAAHELGKTAEDQGLTAQRLLPTMDDWEVFAREAVAVGSKAIEQEVARVKLTPDELYNTAIEKIKKARQEADLKMETGLIPKPPE
jgi:malate dehydrogenase (oxaloacetate-decarboxylating)